MEHVIISLIRNNGYELYDAGIFYRFRADDGPNGGSMCQFLPWKNVWRISKSGIGGSVNITGFNNIDFKITTDPATATYIYEYLQDKYISYWVQK